MNETTPHLRLTVTFDTGAVGLVQYFVCLAGICKPWTQGVRGPELLQQQLIRLGARRDPTKAVTCARCHAKVFDYISVREFTICHVCVEQIMKGQV